jgi:group I intron endonuclease
MKGIYIIKNILNDKIYVGSSVKLEAREQRHFKNLLDNKHHSQKLQNAYNKYGPKFFIFKPIEEYENIDNEQLIIREQYWIDYYDSYYKGYNCRPKAKNNHGHKHSEETKKLMSKKQSGKNNGMYGKKLSEEVKERIRQKMLGRFFSEETRKKLRESALNRSHSEETKFKQSRVKKSKPILQLDENFKIIKEWYSRREILRETNICVLHALKKSKTNYTKKFYWVYKNEYKSFIKKMSNLT